MSDRGIHRWQQMHLPQALSLSRQVVTLLGRRAASKAILETFQRPRGFTLS